MEHTEKMREVKCVESEQNETIEAKKKRSAHRYQIHIFDCVRPIFIILFCYSSSFHFVVTKKKKIEKN